MRGIWFGVGLALLCVACAHQEPRGGGGGGGGAGEMKPVDYEDDELSEEEADGLWNFIASHPWEYWDDDMFWDLATRFTTWHAEHFLSETVEEVPVD